MILDSFLSCFYVSCWICLWLVPPAVQGYADLSYINKSCNVQYLTDYIRHQKLPFQSVYPKHSLVSCILCVNLQRKNTQWWGMVLYLHVLSTAPLKGFQLKSYSGGDSLHWMLLSIFHFGLHWSNITCILLEAQIRMCKFPSKIAHHTQLWWIT